MKILPLLWTVIRSSPKAAYYVSQVLYYLPTALALFAKIRKVFGSEDMQDVIQAWGEFIDKVIPPAPTADSAGTIPADLKRERRWRFFQYKNRMKVAGAMTDGEVHIACTAHGITPEEGKLWT